MTTYRTEFAVDGVWYTNALRFTNATEAVAEAAGRFSRWTMPAAWRVVLDTHPEKEPYDGTGHRTVEESP